MGVYLRNHIEITEEVLDNIKQCSKMGMRKEQIADYLGMHRSTFYKKLKEDQRIVDAYRLGAAIGNGEISTVVYQKAMDGDMRACTYLLTRYDTIICEDVNKNSLEQINIQFVNTGDPIDVSKQYCKIMTGK